MKERHKKILMYFLILILLISWIIVMTPNRKNSIDKVLAYENTIPNSKLINETLVIREMTIITDSPCRYVTHIAEQKYIRKIIQASSCYKDVKVNGIGYKGIEINKFCGNIYADGYIIVKDGNNITKHSFTLDNNEVYCI